MNADAWLMLDATRDERRRRRIDWAAVAGALDRPDAIEFATKVFCAERADAGLAARKELGEK